MARETYQGEETKMKLVYGEVVDLLNENDMKVARVRIAGAFRNVPVDLISDVQCGDKILLCDGVAIGKMYAENRVKEGHVPGDSR
jgi:hydrogenase maturation factor